MNMPAVSLYIHIPWCIRKCLYCDFNSHKSPDTLPEESYIKALIQDLENDLKRFPVTKEISSVFIGGGTPSLFSATAFHDLFSRLQEMLNFSSSVEITLEANPGTVEQERFRDYRQAGINRLSLGIQSFNPFHLKALGRIHDEHQSHAAIESARLAGFDNINLDIMHSLPQQTVEEGLKDLQIALSYKPEHLSWYQLTIEPNTVFYKKQPILPSEDDSFQLEEQGLALLEQSGFQRYEISAFSQAHQWSRHNLNYWLFGDYLGIGAGAHGKLTIGKDVFRTRKQRQPKDYLNPQKDFLAAVDKIDEENLLFEFMLNTTRLEQAIPFDLFFQKTGLSSSIFHCKLTEAINKKLIKVTPQHWQVTPLGRRYTNDLQSIFLPDELHKP